MRTILFKALPYAKEAVTLALESGVDGLIVPDDKKALAAGLARGVVYGESEVVFVALHSKEDERKAEELYASGGPALTVVASGWEVIPVENLLASSPQIGVEAKSFDEAVLAAGVLERGADTVVVGPEALDDLKNITAALKYACPALQLQPAVVTRVSPAGMGHRVCVDTTGIMKTGQGMLVGNSAAFTFLVNAETEHNEYVAARPFRVNAGAVHAYAVLPGDKTAYLEELSAGSEVLVVNHQGESTLGIVGRVKVEKRPMLLVEAKLESGESGAVFLQNAETIRLVTPEGTAKSVVELVPGDRVLCRADVAGRHFGMRIVEDIKEN